MISMDWVRAELRRQIQLGEYLSTDRDGEEIVNSMVAMEEKLKMNFTSKEMSEFSRVYRKIEGPYKIGTMRVQVVVSLFAHSINKFLFSQKYINFLVFLLVFAMPT